MEKILVAAAHELLLKKGAIMIDVRTKEEFAAAHIENAIHMPLETVTLEEIVRHMQEQEVKTVIFQCFRGTRSAIAIKKLIEANPIIEDNPDINFRMYNLEGGIKAWIAAGFPIVEDLVDDEE